MRRQYNISFGLEETERHEDLKRLFRYYFSDENDYDYDSNDGIEEESLLRELESKELDINYLKISDNSYINSVGWSAVYIIRRMTNLRTLDLSFNFIEDQEEYYPFSKAFEKLTNLTSINLSCCDIKNGTEIFENLRNCTALTHLDLCTNSIRSGLESFAKAELKELKYIDLSFNKIEPKGATSLAEVLHLNKSLTHLDLTCNGIGPEGATSLAEVLGELKVLTFFDVSSNMIQEEGASSIAEALGQSDALVDLDLGDNNIGPRGAAYITEILAECTSLTRISTL